VASAQRQQKNSEYQAKLAKIQNTQAALSQLMELSQGMRSL
jgi:hypothetical protein